MECNMFSGVVEGFYGKPWSQLQRLELFQRLEYMGLNTYLYAPKDDMKHRQMWRELYTKQETMQLKYLIDASKKHNVTFVYAISPGIDIVFSNATDTVLLKQKMQQVSELGCEAFSLLFDDICPSLGDIDKGCFQSLASAQASLTNDIYDYLKQPKFFLFCPTEYCAKQAIPTVTGSEYLSTIGTNLKSNIDIMWTGPMVISKFITLESILELCSVLKRRPVIWDNIHANDYDKKRLFLGPYCGRPSELLPHLRGILTNPNCEFEANFVAIHTLAQWVKSNGDGDTQTMEYIPSVALRLALTDWLEIFYQDTDTRHEYKTSISCTSAQDIGQNRLPHNSDATPCTPVAMFSPDKVTTPQGITSQSSITHDGVINSPVPLILTDLPEEVLKDPTQHHVFSTDKTSPLLVLSPSRIDEGKTATLPNLYNIYPSDYKVSASDEMPLKENTEKANVNEMLSQQSDMETMENSLNMFPLTPMETEDSDAENVVDPMAMQVDSTDDGNCEIMDVIDAKTYPEPNKVAVSSHGEESDMEDTTSNESVDLTETTVCNSISKLTLDDLTLLSHLFFLPYEHGPMAIKILELIYWLRSHSYLVADRHNQVKTDPLSIKDTNTENSDNESESLETRAKTVESLEWFIKAKDFEDQVELVRNLVDKIINIPNRSILFELYPYIQDVRHVLGTLSSYVKWMGSTSGFKESFMSDDHEPSMFRGGIISELQRMFPLEGSNDIFPNRTCFFQNPSLCESSLYDVNGAGLNDNSNLKIAAPNDNITSTKGVEGLQIQSSIFLIRPYSSCDKPYMYDLCFDLLSAQLRKDSGLNSDHLKELQIPAFKDLVGDRYLGSFLEFSPTSCMVLENEDGNIIGYVLASSSVHEMLLFRRDLYAEQMRIKYESKINLLSPDDESISKSKSIVKTLIEGFFNDSFYDIFQDIKDKPRALVQFNMAECYKDTNKDNADTLSQRLLKCIFSTLKSTPDKTLDVTDCSETCLEDLSLNESGLINGPDQLGQSMATRRHSHSKNSLNSSMVICCELDRVSKCWEDFYQRCGFTKCNVGDDFSSVSVMSRYI